MTKKRGQVPNRGSDAARAERREEGRRLTAEAIEQLRSSEGWRRWLGTRRHFHAYSLRNQLLIFVQMPEATRVAGFGAWLNLGYAVRKGQHGILIWAPCRPSRRKMRAWREAGADPGDRPRTFFRLVKVFDHSQVDPLPDFPGGPVDLDPPVEPIEGDTLAYLFEPLRRFGILIGSPIRIEAGGAAGSYDKRDRRIQVNPVGEDFSPNAQVETAIHELAHALVRSDREDDDPQLSYGEEEVVVECVAHGVCATVGLDTSESSIPYMAGWGSGEEIERYAALVDRLARRLEDAVLAVSPPHSAESDLAVAAA